LPHSLSLSPSLSPSLPLSLSPSPSLSLSLLSQVVSTVFQDEATKKFATKEKIITIVAKRAYAKSQKKDDKEKGKGKDEKEGEGSLGEKKGKELAVEEIGGIKLNLIEYANATEKPVTEVSLSLSLSPPSLSLSSSSLSF
jgi:hypothetical protein